MPKQYTGVKARESKRVFISEHAVTPTQVGMLENAKKYNLTVDEYEFLSDRSIVKVTSWLLNRIVDTNLVWETVGWSRIEKLEFDK